MLTLHNEFKAKLKEITELSNKINKNDNRKILEMMKKHVDEIDNPDRICDDCKFSIINSYDIPPFA